MRPAAHAFGVLVAMTTSVAVVASQRAGGPPSPAQSTSSTSGTGAMSGVVVDGTTGEPVPGAVVAISSDQETSTNQRRLVTDDRGRFTFSGLPPGSYALTADQVGYTPTQYGASDPLDLLSARLIEITDGQRLLDIRLKLWRPAAISGTLVDETGEPVVGALVRVTAPVFLAGRTYLAGGYAAKTDDRGRYRISQLIKGRYYVMVPSVQATVPTGVMAAQPLVAGDQANRVATVASPIPVSTHGVYPPVYFANSRTSRGATPIDVDWGDERDGVNLQLTPVRGVSVSGIAYPAAEVNGMPLRLVPSSDEDCGLGCEVATTLARPDGRFTFLNVPEGNYLLVASRSIAGYEFGELVMSAPPQALGLPMPPGFELKRGFRTVGGAAPLIGLPRFTWASGPGNTDWIGRVAVIVGERNVDGFEVPLQRGVALNGRIVWAASPQGRPPSRGMLSIFAEAAHGEPYLGMPTTQVLNGAETTFRIDGLLPGRYVLRFGSSERFVRSIMHDGRDHFDRAFDASGGAIEDVVITMTTDITAIAGRVRGEAGNSTPTRYVVAFPADRSLWDGYGLSPRRLQFVRVSADATFTLHVPAGDYFALAVDRPLPVSWRVPAFLEAASVHATRVTVGWGETKSLALDVNTVVIR
jgi:hypothetical protein